ncbi:MAG: OpgC domain-containing protein [Colwellia sp.]
MKRIIELDGLRGWLLIIIACNHLYGGYVTQFTREPLGFVSAAEGFVFLSGFVAYLVYSRLFDKEKNNASNILSISISTSTSSASKEKGRAPLVTEVDKKIWHRCLTIYKYHLFSLFFVYALIWFFPVYKSIWIDFFYTGNLYDNPVSAIGFAVLLLEQPGYFDILVMYLVPMTFLPFAIKAMKRGQVTWVVVISFSIWLLAQFINQDILISAVQYLSPSTKLQLSYFDPFAWQWLFYLGVFCSYLRFDKHFTFVFSPLVKSSLICLALVLMLLKHIEPAWLNALFVDGSLKLLFGESGSVPILRQINLLLLAYCFFLSMNKLAFIYRASYPVYLGQHALAVFAFHTVAIYWLYPLFMPQNATFWYWDLFSCILFITLLSLAPVLEKAFNSQNRNPSKKEA